MKHALVIEDFYLIASMLQDCLKDYGYTTVDVASSQAQAIEMAEQRCPDLITADDRLEQGTGIEAIRHICRDQAIPVVFIVADETNVKKMLPDAILLLKPYSESALAAAIKLAEATPFVLEHAN